MGPGEVMGLLIAVSIPTILIGYVIRRLFALKEKQVEAESRLAAEKAAQYATSNSELETRVRVLEQIITDGGLETAAQIEALRAPRLTKGDKVS